LASSFCVVAVIMFGPRSRYLAVVAGLFTSTRAAPADRPQRCAWSVVTVATVDVSVIAVSPRDSALRKRRQLVDLCTRAGPVTPGGYGLEQFCSRLRTAPVSARSNSAASRRTASPRSLHLATSSAERFRLSSSSWSGPPSGPSCKIFSKIRGTDGKYVGLSSSCSGRSSWGPSPVGIGAPRSVAATARHR